MRLQCPMLVVVSLLAACGDGALEEFAADSGTNTEEEPDAAGIAEPSQARVTSSLGLRIRSAPALDGEQLGTIPEGCLVTLLGGQEGDWLEVEYNEIRGWSHKDFLQLEEVGAEDCQVVADAMLLPWDADEAYKVTNGHGTATHTDFDEWAWDFGMPVGTPLLAVHGGTVRRTKGNSTRGGCSQTYISDANYVVIDRGDGTEALYFHLDSVSVQVGQTVQRGQLIGYSGDTGWACGAHLHFQVQKGPTGGGTSSGWNPSIHSFFHDTGTPLDPAPGSSPVSANQRP